MAAARVRSPIAAASLTLALLIVPLFALTAYSYEEIAERAALRQPTSGRDRDQDRCVAAAAALSAESNTLAAVRRYVIAASDYGTNILSGLRAALASLAVAATIFLFTAYYVVIDADRIMHYIRGPHSATVRRAVGRARIECSRSALRRDLFDLPDAGDQVAHHPRDERGVSGPARRRARDRVVHHRVLSDRRLVERVRSGRGVAGGIPRCTHSGAGDARDRLLRQHRVHLHVPAPKIAAERSRVLNFYWMLVALVTGVYTFGLVGILLGPMLIGLLKAILDTIASAPAWEWSDHGSSQAVTPRDKRV